MRPCAVVATAGLNVRLAWLNHHRFGVVIYASAWSRKEFHDGRDRLARFGESSLGAASCLNYVELPFNCLLHGSALVVLRVLLQILVIGLVLQLKLALSLHRVAGAMSLACLFNLALLLVVSHLLALFFDILTADA